MICKKCAAVMSDYIDENLAGHVCLEFETHIAQCPHCAAELAAMENLLASLKSLSCCQAPMDCRQSVMSKIKTQKQQSARESWLLRPIYAVPAFAALMILVLLLILPAHLSDQPAAVNNIVPIPEYASYISAHSRAQRQQALSDPHVTFIAAELEKASLTTDSVTP
ncbi:MAG: zf-HC2 domain-containing protein [Armatimonadota bacterium]|nr:zf-HC2 domain-containing protein [bacterium]